MTQMISAEEARGRTADMELRRDCLVRELNDVVLRATERGSRSACFLCDDCAEKDEVKAILMSAGYVVVERMASLSDEVSFTWEAPGGGEK